MFFARDICWLGAAFAFITTLAFVWEIVR